MRALDVLGVDELARRIANAVDGNMSQEQWDRASMDYRIEFTEGAYAALDFLSEEN